MNIRSEFSQYNPVYEFHSDRTGITLQITDNYQVRNEMLGQMKRNANTWFELALGRAPMELQSTLQVSCMHTVEGFSSYFIEISLRQPIIIRYQFRRARRVNC